MFELTEISEFICICIFNKWLIYFTYRDLRLALFLIIIFLI